MPTPRIVSFVVWEDGQAFVMARILGNDGSVILQANVSSIAAHVYDLNVESPGATDLWGSALVVASTVFDTLQQTADDPRWTKDTTGYNFAVAVPASALPEYSQYRGEIIFTPTSGDVFPLVFQLNTIKLYSS